MLKVLIKVLCSLILGVTCLFLVTQTVYAESNFIETDYYSYEKKFITEEFPLCSESSVKTYMDYKKVTNKDSAAYKHINNFMTVDEKTGLLMDEDGFIGVALGYQFGDIGSRYYITLSNGQTLPVVKVDSKSKNDTPNGCQHSSDGSVIEFVIDSKISGEYFGIKGNGYVASGNFNNIEIFKGTIISIELVTNESVSEKRIVNYVTDKLEVLIISKEDK